MAKTLVKTKGKYKSQTGCPIEYGLSTFGDKWSLIIVRDIMFKGKKYYGDFACCEEGISTNILASRLAELEENGILNKDRDPENKTKFIYSLTEKGKDLLPIMAEMVRWANNYDPETTADRHLIEELEQDREAFIEKMRGLIGQNIFNEDGECSVED